MANQPHNPQQQNQPRNAPPTKQAPGQGQAGKSGADKSGPQPQNPADLGHDPKPDNIQAGRMGQSGEKSQH